jgi:hypothetical protein
MNEPNRPDQQPAKMQSNPREGAFAFLKMIPALIFALIMLGLIVKVAATFFDLFTSPSKSVLELPGK